MNNSYKPILYTPQFTNPNVIYLGEKYKNLYYTSIINTPYTVGDYFERIIAHISNPGTFIINQITYQDIRQLIDLYQLPDEYNMYVSELLKIYILCLPLNVPLISSLAYDNDLPKILLTQDPYMTSQLLDLQSYIWIGEYLGINLSNNNYYSRVVFNELFECYIKQYLELYHFSTLNIGTVNSFNLMRFNDFLSDVVENQRRAFVKIYEFFHTVDDLLYTTLIEDNVSIGSAISSSDYNEYLAHSNNSGISPIIYGFFGSIEVGSSNVSANSSIAFNILLTIRRKILECISIIDFYNAPVETSHDILMTSISDIYKNIHNELYLEIMGYLLNNPVYLNLNIHQYIPNTLIATYLTNISVYEFITLIQWVISRDIDPKNKNDRFLIRLAGYMQHSLLCKEVIQNAEYS